MWSWTASSSPARTRGRTIRSRRGSSRRSSGRWERPDGVHGCGVRDWPGSRRPPSAITSRLSLRAGRRDRPVPVLLTYGQQEAKMKAARIQEYNKSLVLEDVPVPDIQPDEELVQVRACGMCRSDVQLVDGYFRKYADIPTPITPGHEITGVVHKLGGLVPRSVGYQEGDHVVVAPGWGDGTCRHCQIGNTQICPNVRWPGFGSYGGFAEFIPVPARYVIKVDSRLKFEELAPLTDAGLTPYRGIKKLRDAGALVAGRVLGVFGIGGLGAYAVQYAKLLGGGTTVVAFARNPDKLAVAKQYGADHIINIRGKPQPTS